MKKIIIILIVVCFISLIGCVEDKKPTLSIENIDSISKIKNFNHLYISKFSFSKDWVVWIDIGSNGNNLKAEGRDKILENALYLAIEKAERFGECLEK